jgi:penicillin amidase
VVLSRLVRVVNLSIAIIVVLVLAAVYWWAVRPLPKTQGEVAAPIGAPAVIKRDARGVPHIEAASWQDAIFLQGFVTAQDRLWQMDSLRRYSGGELAEVFGASAVPLDERSRRMRMRVIADNNVRLLTPEDRAVMIEYARGVNYFIDGHRGNYSIEFSLPGHMYNPRPWTLSDSMLIGLVMFRDLTDDTVVEFDKAALLDGGADPVKVKVLFPASQGHYASPGSNAWAISGAHSADGKPLASNDPHLTYGIPGTWHLVHLKAPGLNVSGAALPGLPCVITGHNQQIAWGVTSLGVDVMDFYSEQIDERTGRYIYQGKPQQAQLDRETIAVRDAKPVQVDIWVTRHGPIVRTANGKSYSMRWSAAEGFGFPFFKINRAGNWKDFRAALSTFWGPGQNFVYADRAGNIGYQVAGRVPIRRDFDGDVPLDGASGKFEWNGYIPFEQLPQLSNPPSGIIATANQNSFPTNYPYRISGSFADKYRVQQIRAMLSAKSKLTVDDLLAVQKDVYSAYDFFLAQQTIAAFKKYGSKDKLAPAAIEVLRRWNGQMDKDEAGPVITQLLSAALDSSLVKAATSSPKQGPPTKLRTRPQVIETMLRKRPAGWVPKDDWDAALLDSLSTALRQGRQRQGTPVSRWHWGRFLQWSFEHPVGKQLPFVDRFFDIGPIEMSGSGTTVKQTTATLGPSERMDVDLGDLDKSLQNLIVGESGFVASGHYKDQWPAYYSGRSFPMEFDHVDAKDVLRVHPGQ